MVGERFGRHKNDATACNPAQLEVTVSTRGYIRESRVPSLTFQASDPRQNI
jgi:hypothetical protein